MSVLPWKSITIGTLFEENVDKSRTASFVDWAVVVVAIDVVDAIVVVSPLHYRSHKDILLCNFPEERNKMRNETPINYGP